MKRWLRNGLARLLAGVIVAAMTGAWAIGEVQGQRAAAQRDKDEVARMIQKMTTVCIGRFLIDLPGEAQFELSQPRIDGFDIAVFDEGQADFEARLAQREARLHATPDRLGGGRNVESAREVRTPHGVVGKMFVHGRTVREGTRLRGLEQERYRFEHVAVEALVHAQGLSFELSAPKVDEDGVDRLAALVGKLVPNPANEAPQEPGFCIDRAWFRDPLGAEQGEQVVMRAMLPSHPDIDLMLMVAAGEKPEQRGLLERGADVDAALPASDKARLSNLRAQARTIGGLAGEELATRAIETNEALVYGFWWELKGSEDNVFIPHLSLTMETGKGDNGPVPSSLSERAAMSLWDSIASSIRLRPTRDPQALAAEPAPTPLGAYALAGERCPESGWWLCGEGVAGIGVLGGQRQHIRKGERMPQALLLPPQTMWEKLRGVQRSFEMANRTSWKLVDKRDRKRVAAPLPLAQAQTATAVAAAGMRGAGSGPRVLEEQGVPLGTYAATGLPCPASGWWRCEDPRALDGTRWFARGSLLPSATFALPPSAFGRALPGTQSIVRRGAWRLVRLAEAPVEEQVKPQAAVRSEVQVQTQVEVQRATRDEAQVAARGKAQAAARAEAPNDPPVKSQPGGSGSA